ncbi:MAG: phosphoglucosamine mutase [Rickettsiales bacterium]|nr:phosphoglucosamine mutase [Rickettsiales bacterium]
MTKRQYFGTDGVRGRANTPPMDAETLLKLAKATCLKFKNGKTRHKVVIGKDTRLSGYMVEPALTAGFISMGWDVVILGPVPTPAVANFTRSLRADLGVMISASHNPFYDNGVKFFNSQGSKFTDEQEAEIEALMQDDLVSILPTGEKLGRASRLDDAVGRYAEYVKATFPRHLRLDGLKVVVDCAHGAAYKVAPQVLWELGAEVITVGNNPNGTNINDGVGATYPNHLAAKVLQEGADIGFALDGDADRVIFCDEKGQIADGDQIMALISSYLKTCNLLKGDGVVATVMSNMGLEQYLSDIGLTLHRSKVGDRYVIEAMKENGINFGGEQSGHIVMSDFGTTGDGMIAALQVLAVYAETGKRASDLFDIFQPYPQLTKSVTVKDKTIVSSKELTDLAKEKEADLGKGRILLRASGTEPVIRVMAEGKDFSAVEKVVKALCDEIVKIDNKQQSNKVA